MCLRKDMGPRCSNQSHQRLNSHQQELATAEQELKEHAEAYESGEYADAAEIKKRRNQLANTVARLKGQSALLQANYDFTKDGITRLGQELQDPNLTDAEMDKLEQRVKNAKDIRNEWEHRRATAKAQSAALTSVLFNAGVDDADIAEIQHLASMDKKNPHPRSVADYKKSLDLARANREQLKTTQEAEVAALYKKAGKDGLSQEETAQAVKALDAEHAKAMKVATDKNKKARESYDSTVEGQAALRELLDSTPHSDYMKRSTLRFRIQVAEKTRRDGLSDRQARVLLKRKITEVMNAQGKSPKLALAALKVKGSDLGKPVGIEPDARIVRVQAHMTESHQTEVYNRFLKSPEYKASGDKGLSDYHRRLATGDPMAKAPKSVDDANAKAEMFDKGLPHRHKTSKSGHRNVPQPIYLTAKEKRAIATKAESHHMSISSYVDAMVTGRSVFAIQNDRSEKNNRKKTNAMRKLLRQAA